MKASGIHRISLTVLLALTAFFPEAGYGWLSAGQRAPVFSLEDVNGNVYKLSDMKDRPLVVLFFCDLESDSNQEGLKSFTELAKQYGDTDMVFWAITFTSKETVSNLIAESKPDVPILLDNAGASDAYEAIRVLPITYVIEPGLKILGSFQGGGKTTEVQLGELVQNPKPIVAKDDWEVPAESEEPEEDSPPPSRQARIRPLPPSPRTQPAELTKETARKLFDLAQKENAKLKWNQCLAGKAYQRAKDLIEKGQFDHKDPKTGKNPAWTLISSCRKVKYAGENLVRSKGEGALSIHRALMQSSSHRENILNARYNLMGVGCYKTVCVELFAGT